jgi:hypothetical protein
MDPPLSGGCVFRLNWQGGGKEWEQTGLHQYFF